MYQQDNGRFKEAIIFWDTNIDKTADVDVFFFIHDFEGRAQYKYGFKSLEIDLNTNRDEIFAGFKPNLRNELRRASEFGFECEFIWNPTIEQLEFFVEKYNEFADFKKLGHISLDLLKKINADNKLLLSYVKFNGSILTGHSHYLAQGRTRLYHSFSTLNSLSSKENALANKFLTEQDIFEHKARGFKVYDFGGIGNVEGDNSRFEGIIQFKKTFGGKEVILWKGITPNGERGIEVMKKYFSQIVFKK